MKRRDFIRNLAISSGTLLLPTTLLSYAIEQKIHIVIIGGKETRYIDEFCKQNSISSFTSIGWYEEHIIDLNISNDKNIEFDFSSITVNHEHPLENSVIIPQQIRDVFKPNNRYLILCNLYRQEALLTNEIFNWCNRKQIDCWLFGSIPLLNPRIGPWAEQLFSKYENHPKFSKHDNNIYVKKLQREKGEILLTDAVTKCDDKLVEELNVFYKNFLSNYVS